MSLKITRDRKTLKIELPLETPWLSKSAKTLLVASTHGPRMTEAIHKGRNISLLLNAYIRPTEKELKRLQERPRRKPRKSRNKPPQSRR